MNVNSGRTKNGVLLALALGIGLGACDDSTTGVDDDEHFEPVTMQLVLGGQVLVTAGSVGGPVQGEIELEVGQETAHVTVRFLDEDGNVTAPDDDVFLQVEIEDSGVADFEQDTPGEFGGHFHGEAAGHTDMVFMVMHGDHADWISADVHVDVNNQSGS
jgi:hypothetical protein